MSEEKEDHEHLHYHGVDKAEQHISVSDALTSFLKEIRTTKPERIKVTISNGRALFSDVSSPQDPPRLARSSRDGYAIKLPEVGTNPAGRTFKLIGEVRIGQITNLVVNAGEAARVATGSFIPRGANAVVMREYSTVEGSILQILEISQAG